MAMSHLITSRSDLEIWLVGSCSPQIIGEMDGKVQFSHYNNQLPTRRDVLKHLFHKKKEEQNLKIPLKMHCAAVIDEVMIRWEKAKIPTITKNNATMKLEKLFQLWKELEKNKKKSHSKAAKDREVFIKSLDDLFDIVSSRWEKDILGDRLRSKEAKQEDLRFIVDQRGPRNMFMEREDKLYEHSFIAKKARLESELQQKHKEEQRKRKSGTSHMVFEDTDDESSDCDDVEAIGDFLFKDTKKSDTITLEVPKKILNNPDLCTMADRIGMSSNNVVGLLSTVLKAGGGDLNEFSLSSSTAHRGRTKLRQQEYEQFYRDFQPPKHAIIGWDGKIVPARNVLGSDRNIEYLAVIVSGLPSAEEGIVLEVEEIDSSSGENQANAVHKLQCFQPSIATYIT